MFFLGSILFENTHIADSFFFIIVAFHFLSPSFVINEKSATMNKGQ